MERVNYTQILTNVLRTTENVIRSVTTQRAVIIVCVTTDSYSLMTTKPAKVLPWLLLQSALRLDVT